MGKAVNVVLMCTALAIAYHEGRKSMWIDYTRTIVEIQADKAKEKKNAEP